MNNISNFHEVWFKCEIEIIISRREKMKIENEVKKLQRLYPAYNGDDFESLAGELKQIQNQLEILLRTKK